MSRTSCAHQRAAPAPPRRFAHPRRPPSHTVSRVTPLLISQVEVDADVEAQSAGFVASQPAQSRPFLAEFCRTQMFLCFVQPQQGDGNLRGGRCFQLALER